MTEEKDEKLVVTITFDSPTSAMFKLEATQSMLPYQTLMLASFFEFEGKYALSQVRAAQEAQMLQQMEEQEKIARLRPEVLTPS